jgi:dTDP-4-dehydrorhamnose reductase
MIILGNGILGSALAKRCPTYSVPFTQFTREDIDLAKNTYEEILKAININDNHVVNTMAYTDVDKAERDKELAFQTNAVGVYKLAIACKSLKKHLTHISTDFVFSGERPSGIPYTEYDEPKPISWYGHTKLCSEQMLINSGCPHTIIRTSFLYNKEKGIIPYLINKISNEEKIIAVNNQFIAPTFAASLADLILDKIDYHSLPGIIHATSNGQTTPVELIKYIAKGLNKNPSIVEQSVHKFYAGRARRPAICLLDNFNLKALDLDAMPIWEADVIGLIQS